MTQREEVVFNWNWEMPKPPQPDPINLGNEHELMVELMKQHDQLIRNECRFEANDKRLEELKNCAVTLLGWVNQLGNSSHETKNAVLEDREKFSRMVTLVEKLEFDSRQAGANLGSMGNSISELWEVVRRWSPDFTGLSERLEKLKEEFGRLGLAVVSARQEDLTKIDRVEAEVESLKNLLFDATQKIAQLQGQSGGQKISEEMYSRLEAKQRMLEEGFHHLERVGMDWDKFVTEEMQKLAGGYLSVQATVGSLDRRQSLLEEAIVSGRFASSSLPQGGVNSPTLYPQPAEVSQEVEGEGGALNPPPRGEADPIPPPDPRPQVDWAAQLLAMSSGKRGGEPSSTEPIGHPDPSDLHFEGEPGFRRKEEGLSVRGREGSEGTRRRAIVLDEEVRGGKEVVSRLEQRGRREEVRSSDPRVVHEEFNVHEPRTEPAQKNGGSAS